MPEENPQPVKQETTCETAVGLAKGSLIAPTEAVRRGRAFLVHSIATFMGVSAPDGTRRYIGVKGTLYPSHSLDSSSLVYEVTCSDSPSPIPGGTAVVKAITPRPEIKIYNNNEFQTFQALAPISIWGDGSLDGSLIPSLEWVYGSGWRVTLVASRQSVRSDVFNWKRSLDRPVFGGKGALETYEGTTANSFVIVYTIDGIVNGKAVKVRNEIEYVAL